MEDEKIDDDRVDISSCKHPLDHPKEEEEASEKMKMEKFYSLIRNYHDARNRLRSRKLPYACNEDADEILDDDDDDKNLSINVDQKRRKTMGDDDRGEPSAAGGRGGGWVPSFELEDFGTEVMFGGGPHLLFPPPPPPCSNYTSKNIEKQDEGLGSLDLKLAL